MTYYKVLCLIEHGDDMRLVFASRSKLFASRTSANDYAGSISSDRKAEVWRTDQVIGALWLASKCRCHDCQYCQIARDYWSNPGKVTLETPKEHQLCLISN